jgi:hypothetical protein
MTIFLNILIVLTFAVLALLLLIAIVMGFALFADRNKKDDGFDRSSWSRSDDSDPPNYTSFFS